MDRIPPLPVSHSYRIKSLIHNIQSDLQPTPRPVPQHGSSTSSSAYYGHPRFQKWTSPVDGSLASFNSFHDACPSLPRNCFYIAVSIFAPVLRSREMPHTMHARANVQWGTVLAGKSPSGDMTVPQHGNYHNTMNL